MKRLMDMNVEKRERLFQGPDIEGIKANLSEKIISVLDDQKLTVRQAQAVTKISAADFSRIRNADLGRFTIDRLIRILNRLDRRVNINIEIGRLWFV